MGHSFNSIEIFYVIQICYAHENTCISNSYIQYACITDQVLTFMWCLKVKKAYTCNRRSRNGFHAPTLVRNDISHLIIGLLVENIVFFKMSADGHLGFSPFSAKRDIGIIPKVNTYYIYYSPIDFGHSGISYVCYVHRELYVC